MFTGIIETVGNVVSAKRVSGDVRLVISAPDYAKKDINLGDSIACNGACLTVVERQGEKLSFDVSVESMEYTLLGDWNKGARVNLEMALLPTTRLGGHLVSGHVDGLAKLVQLKEDARSWRMEFELPNELCKYVAKKGSITINGISLTVNSINSNRFGVNVIPHTFEVTTLGDVAVTEFVHIEVDLIARYLESLILGNSGQGKGQNVADSASELSMSFLGEHGFLSNRS